MQSEGTLAAGGWQPFLAYGALIANLGPTLERTPPPPDPMPLLEHFTDGLTTAEIAALLADGSDPIPDLYGAERALLDLAARERLSPYRSDGTFCESSLIWHSHSAGRPTRACARGAPSGEVVAHPPSVLHPG